MHLLSFTFNDVQQRRSAPLTSNKHEALILTVVFILLGRVGKE